jgi:ferredoxin
MQCYTVTLEPGGETFACAGDQDLLTAMRSAACRGIPVGCCNGGCGACRVRIVSGTYVTRKMSRAVISESDEASHCVLACRTYPHSDVHVRVLGRKWPVPSENENPSSAVQTTDSHCGAKRRN